MSYSLKMSPDGFYGSDMGNGTFSGVVGMVQVKEVVVQRYQRIVKLI
jgi:hypothetical protein